MTSDTDPTIDETVFVQKICKAHADGFGFVPLIGSGVSANSGVPVVSQLREYLKRCVCMSIPDIDANGLRPWRPRSDRWPSLRGGLSFGDPFEWLRVKLNRYRANDSRDPLVPVMQLALGGMADWRAMLQFLARLQVDHSTGQTFLGAQDNTVIDRFFLQVVADRSPSFAHRMLAHLADHLRFSVLLTTNFDELLEQAFANAGKPLESYDVHLNRSLPNISLLTKKRALIKLHGGRYGLRADYSLDADPTEEELKCFLSYFRSTNHARNHLLVMGFSADDRRIRAMIKKAWAELEDFTVFWVAYTTYDQQVVRDFVTEAHEGTSIAKQSPPCVITTHSQLSLLLLATYQRLIRRLPPQDVPFPSIARVPLPPQPMKPTEPTAGPLEGCKASIHSQIDDLNRPDNLSGGPAALPAPPFRLISVSSKRNVAGVTTAAHDVFYHYVDRGWNCIWLDMDSVTSADDLFEQLLEAVSFKTGIVNWMPMVQQRDEHNRGDLLREFASAIEGKWLIVLNAREAAGCNFEPFANPDEWYEGNGWIDHPTKQQELFDYTANRNDFIALLRDVCRPELKDLTTMLLCRDSPSSILQSLTEGAGFLPGVVLPTSHFRFNAGDVLRKALSFAKKSVEQKQFLLALVLMQRTRYIAALAGDAFFQASVAPADRWTKASVHIEHLHKARVIRKKQGGAVWMHVRTRNAIRQALRKEYGPRWNAMCADTHLQLAEWYDHLFWSSHSPAAAFEVIYHALRHAEYYARQNLATTGGLVCNSLNLVKRTLIEAEPFILSRGFSRRSCRRLVWIRHNYLEAVRTAAIKHSRANKGVQASGRVVDSCKEVARLCVSIMAKLAREIAEHQTSYLRYRQLRELVTTGQVVHNVEVGSPPPGDSRIASTFEVKVHRKDPALVSNWWRHVAILGIASRAYGKSAAAFRTCKRLMDKSTNLPLIMPRAKYFVRHLQLQATKIELASRLLDHCSEGQEKLNKLGKVAEISYEEAVRVIRGAAPERDWHATYSQLVRAGLYLSTVKVHQRQYEEAADLLDQSTKYAFRLDPSGFSKPFAVVYLCSADIVLERVSRQFTAMTELCRWCRDDLRAGDVINSAWKANLESPKIDDIEKREIKALLKDAESYLDSAVPILLNHAKNVWWSSWYFERRSRSIELGLYLAMLDRKRPVPYVGMEASAQGEDTIIEGLLGLSERMIRLDVYRFATALDAYVSCVRATMLNIVVRDMCAIPIDRLRRTMRNRLTHSIDRLKELLKRRDDIDKSLSKDIRTYIDIVLQRATKTRDDWPFDELYWRVSEKTFRD